jgi:pimeloyl-ACP methyl ester carboxylesterase
VHNVQRLLVVSIFVLSLAFASGASAALHVEWMPGAPSPGTPARYDRVGVLKVGPAHAKNVLVLEPGTSAGSAYFVPLARWIVSKEKGWQVWAVERRENLLEDQSVLNLAKEHKATATEVYDYYLGYLVDSSITHHFVPVPNTSAEFAKQWGMKVAVGDLHRVIAAAHKLGGKVVLGGHSLGGDVVTAYATWDFGGQPGADGLSGLVYIDGGSFSSVSAAAAQSAVSKLNAPGASPWQPFGGIPTPLAGVFAATGATAALIDPTGASSAQSSGLLTPFGLSPPVPVDNLAQYGYALNVGTSPAELIAAQAHLGAGIAMTGAPPFGWNGAGALTPIKRFAQMFSGQGILHADGTEWFFPQRLTDDTGAVDEGNPNPAQSVLDVRATKGHSLPRSLLIYAFGAALGGPRVLTAATILAQQSHIPLRNLTLVNRQSTYAHNDPAGAYPHNVFFSNLLPFLKKIAAQKRA